MLGLPAQTQSLQNGIAVGLGVLAGSLFMMAPIFGKPAIAQVSSSVATNTNNLPSGLRPSTEPLDLTALQADTLLPVTPGQCVSQSSSVVTVNTICQTRLTLPSLWWTKEQFGGKLLENWLAYAGTADSPARVDLVVNPQVWSLLNYLERYAFVNHFGEVARDYGYNIRVFSRQGTGLAAYTCDFSVATMPPSNPSDAGTIAQNSTKAIPAIPCNLQLETPRRGLVQSRPGLAPLSP